MEFGMKVRVLRAIKGITQSELGEMLDIEPKVISYIETGKLLPTNRQEEQLRTVLEWGGVVDIGFCIMDADLTRELSDRVFAIGEELDVETW